MGCISSPLGPNTSYYKGKTAEKRSRNKIRAKTGKSQVTQARTVVREGRTTVRLPPRAVVGPTVNPWWALPGQVRPLPLRYILCSLGLIDSICTEPLNLTISSPLLSTTHSYSHAFYKSLRDIRRYYPSFDPYYA